MEPLFPPSALPDIDAQGHVAMDTSILIAKFMGPVMLVAGAAMLVNRQQMDSIFKDFLNSPGLIFLAGVLALLTGLVIVNFHNIWVADWPVVVTIFGWICIFAGIFRMGFPTAVKSMGSAMLKNGTLIMVSAVTNTALGAYLSYMGYLA
jgi:hypothetical protein